MVKIGIIDCGISNLASVVNAFKFLSIDVDVTICDKKLKWFSHLVLPGVGTFSQGMHNLCERGLDDAIKEEIKKGKPLLGICLGMQFLASIGEEYGSTDGLGLIPGDILKIDIPTTGLRLPHIGWNDVAFTKSSLLWRGIDAPPCFYFNHSYAYDNIADEHVVGTCEYGTQIVAAVQRGMVFGVQFHPEKSQSAGLHLLKNFSELC